VQFAPATLALQQQVQVFKIDTLNRGVAAVSSDDSDDELEIGK
jgi:hypothetical protein